MDNSVVVNQRGAGTSSLLAALGELGGRSRPARSGRFVAGRGAVASAAFLIHDLGRP